MASRRRLDRRRHLTRRTVPRRPVKRRERRKSPLWRALIAIPAFFERHKWARFGFYVGMLTIFLLANSSRFDKGEILTIVFQSVVFAVGDSFGIKSRRV